MAKRKREKKEYLRWKILKEIYTHYPDLEDYYKRTGQHIFTIPAGYYTTKPRICFRCQGTKIYGVDDYNQPQKCYNCSGKGKIAPGNKGELTEDITISFLDLKYGLDELSPKQKEAFLYNVIYDMTQEEVAEILRCNARNSGPIG